MIIDRYSQQERLEMRKSEAGREVTYQVIDAESNATAHWIKDKSFKIYDNSNQLVGIGGIVVKIGGNLSPNRSKQLIEDCKEGLNSVFMRHFFTFDKQRRFSFVLSLLYLSIFINSIGLTVIAQRDNFI